LSGDKRTQSTHYARASIIFSFSSIEAAINEFFQDIIEKSSTPEAIQELCEADIAKLSAWWKGKNTKGQNNRKPTLRKYKAVIEIIGDYKMNQNYSEDQSIDKFRDFNSLRNILIHYTPEYSDRLRIHQKADEIFEKYDIPINSFFINTQNPIFPSKCMGHGLSKWCIETAIEFIDHFYCTLGLSSKLDICRHELKTR